MVKISYTKLWITQLIKKLLTAIIIIIEISRILKKELSTEHVG